MNRENNELEAIKNMGIRQHLTNLKCSECQQTFSDDDVKENNFSVIFEADGLTDLKRVDDGYLLTARIDKITHEYTTFADCPEVETCGGCDKKFLEKEVKKGLNDDTDFYCSPCFNEKYGDYLKERSKRKKLTSEQKEVMRVIQKAVNEHMTSNYHKGGQGGYSTCEGSDCEGYKQILESYGYERE